MLQRDTIFRAQLQNVVDKVLQPPETFVGRELGEPSEQPFIDNRLIVGHVAVSLGKGTTSAMLPRMAGDSIRQLIISRSLASSLASLFPVPYLDEALAARIRESMIERLADIRSVDLDPGVAAAIASPQPSTLINAAGLGAMALAATRRIWRRVATSIFLYKRVDEAMTSYQVGTLFDHYCQKHHSGAAIDPIRAVKLRRAFEESIRRARGELISDAFDRTLSRTESLLKRLPSPFNRNKKNELPAEADSTRLHRESAALEAEVVQMERGYVTVLTEAFDDVWARVRLRETLQAEEATGLAR